jgi:DNA-binding LacI/PurR family transcriptional regulator
VALIGFDDVPEAAWLSYGLTTFRQDPAAIAARAVMLLDRRQQNPDEPRACERVIPQLVFRKSFAGS